MSPPVSAPNNLIQLETRSTRPARAVAELRPYDAVAIRPATGPGAPEFFKLDWNEATVSPSPRVQEALVAHVTEGPGLNWYPALYDRELAADLEAYVGMPAANMLITAGSDDALRLLCDTFLDTGDVVAVPEPTYAHFVLFAKARGARIQSIVCDDPFRTHLDALLEALARRPRMLYLVNPNNPTGVTYTTAQIEKLLRAAKGTIVIVDEAYIEFGGESVATLAMRHSNLVVTRTFSKAFGLAGCRVGYLCAGAEILEAARILYNPKSVGTMALVAARAALEDLDYLKWFVEEVRQARPLLADWFRSRGHEAFAGEGNFIVVRVPNVTAAVGQLKAARIFVRDRNTQPGLAGCFRVSIGTVAQTQSLIARLESLDF